MRRNHKNHIGSLCRPVFAFPFDISLRILSWTSSRSSLCCNIVLEADFQFFNASCFTSNLLGMSCGILAIKSPFATKATFTCKSPSSGKFSTCRAASSHSSSVISRLAKDNFARWKIACGGINANSLTTWAISLRRVEKALCRSNVFFVRGRQIIILLF